MLPRRDSWVTNYEAVEDLDVPFLSAPAPPPGREGLEERPQDHRRSWSSSRPIQSRSPLGVYPVQVQSSQSERVPDTSSSPLPLPSTTSHLPQATKVSRHNSYLPPQPRDPYSTQGPSSSYSAQATSTSYSTSRTSLLFHETDRMLPFTEAGSSSSASEEQRMEEVRGMGASNVRNASNAEVKEGSIGAGAIRLVQLPTGSTSTTTPASVVTRDPRHVRSLSSGAAGSGDSTSSTESSSSSSGSSSSTMPPPSSTSASSQPFHPSSSPSPSPQPHSSSPDHHPSTFVRPRPTPTNSFSRSFPSSPLNPSSTSPSPPLPSSPFRPGSRPTSAFITRIPSEECRALSTPTSGLSPATSMLSGLTNNNGGGNRGSMILYRLEDVSSLGSGGLLPPSAPHLANRASVYSTSGDSFVSISSDSKYPLGLAAAEHGVVAYAWDPLDDDDDDDAPDSLYSSHPDSKSPIKERKDFSYRGLSNISGLVLLLGAIIALFVVYPVVSFYRNDGVETKITMNSRINATRQAESSSLDLREVEGVLVGRGQRVFGSVSSAPMDAIDPTTPLDAYTQRVEAGKVELLFSDEFEDDWRLFGSDPIWTSSNEVKTSGGILVGSGTVKTRAPFCLGRGFIEVGLGLQENEMTSVYWSNEGWTQDLPTLTQAASIGKDRKVRYGSLITLELGVGSLAPAPVSYVRFYRLSISEAQMWNNRCEEEVDVVFDQSSFFS